jgi:hypothetical protein
VLKGDDVELPELKEGDAALYTGEGGVIIVREAGGIEVSAKGDGDVLVTTEEGASLAVKKSGDIEIKGAGSGKIYLANNQIDNCALITGLIDKIKSLATAGSPAAQTINPASQQILEAYKLEVKKLFAEAG